MANILLVLPYSGTDFGGGLAVLNEKLARALGKWHAVKLLTMKLRPPYSARAATHMPAEIVEIENEEAFAMRDPGKADGELDRDRLYELFNSEKVLLDGGVRELITAGGWEPDIIIGHSRFSGPAAIMLRDRWFAEAKVEYFLHSFPVEGSVLTGYEAYELSIDAELATRKLAQEKEWMPRADVVVGVGPLIRAGAMLILEEARTRRIRVHEAIPGIELTDLAPIEQRNPVPQLLLCGRASAPIKGFEDILLAVLELRRRGVVDFRVDVLYWDTVTYGGGRADERQVDIRYVQRWVNELLGLDSVASDPPVRILPKTSDTDAAYRSHDAVLMPSYIEHFGLVPFEAAGHGVPVLVNEISGAGMFLGDETRFDEVGPTCVVKDFDPHKERPLRPRDFLVDVSPDAFDDRPRAWAAVIEDLLTDLPKRFRVARELAARLRDYTYDHFATSIVGAADSRWNGKVTYQGPRGQVFELRQ